MSRFLVGDRWVPPEANGDHLGCNVSQFPGKDEPLKPVVMQLVLARGIWVPVVRGSLLTSTGSQSKTDFDQLERSGSQIRRRIGAARGHRVPLGVIQSLVGHRSDGSCRPIGLV